MIKILFVGSLIPSDLCGKYLGCSVAANKMQIGIINGLSKMDNNIDVLSTYPIASFPKEKILINKRQIFILNKKFVKIFSVFFINIFILKQITQILSLSFRIIRWGYLNRGMNKIIITFNAFTEQSIPALMVSKIFNITTISILADLPIPSVEYNSLKKIASFLNVEITKKAIKKYDGIIVLNQEAHNRYAPKTPYCLINGGIDLDDYINNSKVYDKKNLSKNKIVLLFTGALINYNGIILLINAVKKMNNSRIILKIYGDGPLKDYIINEAKNNDKIFYGGKISNYEIRVLQKDADFLINPRPTNDDISQVTFPSKILEYIMSGTPVLSTRINCLVDDYKDFLIFISDQPDQMAKDIEIAIKTDKRILDSMTKNAVFEISRTKNWDIHADTIYQFISKSFYNKK
jgi:glycosyltransferase involved in cell wall biosynthesis